MPLLIVAAGGTLVLALRYASRFLRRRSISCDQDLFFPDDDVGPSTNCHNGETWLPCAVQPVTSHLSVSGLGVGWPEDHRLYGNSLSGQAEPGRSLCDENLQALPNYHDSGVPRPGEPVPPQRARDWAVPADEASISSGEARRRAASVRKVRDWDDSGGSHSWTPDPEGSNGGSSSSGGEDEQRRVNDESSAASSPRCPGPSPRTKNPAEGGRQGSEARANVALPVSSSGGSHRTRGGGATAGSPLAAGGLPSDGEAAAAVVVGPIASNSSVMVNCSRGSGTEASVPYRSCGTGTGTLTSSSSPDTSQSAELPELRFDTDSERLKQQQSQKQRQEQQQKQKSKQQKGGLVDELVAAGKAQQADAVAEAASARPVVVAAAAAGAATAESGTDEEGRSERGFLPPALRASSPTYIPPPPPLPPTILATRPPDPQSLLAIQRQVDALRLQHLQRQAQALLAVPAANRATPLTAAVGGGAGALQRSQSPGSAWGGSAGSIAGSTGGGGGTVGAGGGRGSVPGTPASRSGSPCVSSSGGWGGGGEQWTSLSSGPGSPTAGLPPELRQQVDQMLQDMVRRQQQEASPQRQRQQSTQRQSPELGGRGAASLLQQQPRHAGAGNGGADAGGGVPSAAGAAAALSAELGSPLSPQESAFATVQQLLLRPQSLPVGQQPGASPLEQQMQHMRVAWDASQAAQGQLAQAAAGRDGQWPLEAIQAARMGTLQRQSRPSPGAQQPQQQPQQVQQMQQQQAVLEQQLMEWQRLTGLRQTNAGEGLAQQQHQPQAQGSAVMPLLGTTPWAHGAPSLGAWPHQQQHEQQWQAQLQTTSPPRTPGSPTLPGSASGPSMLQQQLWHHPRQQEQQQQRFFSPPRSLSPPQPVSPPRLSSLAGSPQRPVPADAAVAATSPPQDQLGALSAGGSSSQHHYQQQHHHQQPHTHGRGLEPAAAAPGNSGGGGGGIGGNSAEALLSSPPSFRHQLQAGDVGVEQANSAQRTQDWLNNTPTRLASGRSLGMTPYDSGEDVTSPVLRPHPAPPSAVLASHSPPASPRGGGGGFPFTASLYSQRGMQAAAAPPPSVLQHSHSTPASPLHHSNGSGPHASPPASPSFRRQDTLSRQSGGVVSSHGSGHGSRHASVHGSRRESSAARRRREMRELQVLQEKMANLPPPSALALLSAQMLLEAGEVVVPAPKSPGGRAFFVPLKHELRLEMSEQPSSIMSGSQTTIMSETPSTINTNVGLGLRAPSSVASVGGIASGGAGGFGGYGGAGSVNYGSGAGGGGRISPGRQQVLFALQQQPRQQGPGRAGGQHR